MEYSEGDLSFLFCYSYKQLHKICIFSPLLQLQLHKSHISVKQSVFLTVKLSGEEQQHQPAYRW